MSVPVIGSLIQSTVGKVVDRLADRFLPKSMSEEERAKFRMTARKLALEEYRTAMADIQGARELAWREGEGAPSWTKVLTVTHRPLWSFVMLGIFSWTIIAPYLGYPNLELSEVHKDIMQTVIIFYFGGRSVEKTVGILRGR